VSHGLYLAVLVGCLLVTLPLELLLHARVYARWKRLVVTVLPVLAVFLTWDAYAISRHEWAFSRALTLGFSIGDIPVEELLFFVVVPICSVLTYEAVRRR
jgi:lycopene cyclase domain-containing protein